MLITIPFRFLPQKAYSVVDDEGFHLEGVLMFLAAMIITPLIFYFASRLSGEFIIPRKIQNQWVEKPETDKIGQNQSIEPIVTTPFESGNVSLHSASSQTFCTGN